MQPRQNTPRTPQPRDTRAETLRGLQRGDDVAAVSTAAGLLLEATPVDPTQVSSAILTTSARFRLKRMWISLGEVSCAPPRAARPGRQLGQTDRYQAEAEANGQREEGRVAVEPVRTAGEFDELYDPRRHEQGSDHHDQGGPAKQRSRHRRSPQYQQYDHAAGAEMDELEMFAALDQTEQAAPDRADADPTDRSCRPRPHRGTSLSLRHDASTNNRANGFPEACQTSRSAPSTPATRPAHVANRSSWPIIIR